MRLYAKYLKIYFFFLIAVIPLAFIRRCEDAYYLPKLALLLTALQFGYVALRRARFDAIDLALGVFLVFYSLGFIKSTDKAMAFLNWLSLAAAASVFIYARHALMPDERKKAVLVLLGSAFLASAYAVAQVFRLDLKGWVTDFSGRAFSSMGNPDFFGGFLVLVIPLSLFLFYGYGKKTLAASSLAFFSAVLFLSQTRSSLAAFLISLAVLIALFREFFVKNAAVLLAAAAAGFVLVAVTGRFEGLIERLKGIGPENADLQGRVSMWAAGLGMLRDNFFIGAGLSSIRNIFDAYRPGSGYFETDHLHNDFIEIAAESGIFAFAAFAAFVFLAMKGLLKMKNAPGRIIFASAAAMLVHAFFNFPLYIIDTRFCFFMLLGIGLPAGGGEKPGRDTILFALVSAAAFVTAMSALCGSIYLNYGINYAAEKKDASPMFVQAIKLYPGAKKYYYAADWLFKQGNAEGALLYSQKFLEAMPLSKTGCIQAGILAAEAGDPGKAAGFFNTFLRRYPGDEDVLNNLGKVKFMLGRTEEAADIFRQIIAKNPASRLAHESLLAVYINSGQKTEADAETERWNKLKK